jgi:predicted transcriptional regulator
LKLKLVKGDKVILEMPLSVLDWPKEQLETDLKAFEKDFEKFSNMFEALSNITRIKMLRKTLEKKDWTMNFAGYMHDLDLNPKTVWEHSKKLIDAGFLRKTSRGTFQCSECEQTTFLTLSLVLSQILDALEEI